MKEGAGPAQSRFCALAALWGKCLGLGRQKDASRALTDEGYRDLAGRLGRPLSVGDDEDRGHWLVFGG